MYSRSSGSTGLPRAVGETHRMLKQWIILFADVRAEAEHWEPGAMACTHQPEHFRAHLPSTSSADNILEHVRMTKCRSLVTVPVMLTTWLNLLLL
ncbi:hypothetical protein B0H14DRAFT_3510060 [Mycena olivaceomarginata]|nr:hypothetical protein B0H14DRAFT_3510060 [Mycena olivaceomarginata]